jgi:hypothetical protein
VPFFSNKELPIKEPAPLSNYSVGEEISSSPPIAIAWSPPGVAKHRRCALATLTANLVLSIWSADDKPKEDSSWDRRLIVNNALAEYFLSNATDEASHITVKFGEQLRLRTRVRAFTWAPALPCPLPLSTLGSRLSYGQQMVAVCNDDNQIALVVIDSPTSTYGTDRSWSAEVLTHITLTPDSESIFEEPAVFEDMIKQQRNISHVSWSPWAIRGDWYHSIIVYATNDDVRARVVTYAHDSIGLGDEVVYSDIDMRFNGPMRWSSTVKEDVLALALFTTSGLIYLTLSLVDASIVEQKTHDIDGRWDQVTGAVWDLMKPPKPRLHFSSLLSTIKNPTAVLEVDSANLKALESPSWRDQIENSASLFSAKNDLKGNTKMKVWGLSASPLGDFIAACHSVHPSDMIEYGSPADRRGTVAVSALRRYCRIREGFSKRDASTEGVLFTLQRLVENTLEDSDQLPAFVDEMVGKLMQAYVPISVEAGNGTSPTTFVSDELDAVVKDFKRVAMFNAESLKDRYTILASHACNTKSTNTLEKTLIAYRAAESFLGLPNTLSQTSFSTEIRVHHRQAISLIQSLIEPEDADTDTANDKVALDLAATTIDTCDFCSAPVPFTDLASASCTNGHNYPRCGLSFLAIQAPGITKYCGICSTPFLNEEFVMAQEMEAPPERADSRPRTNGSSSALENGAPARVHTNDNHELARVDGDGNVVMGGTRAEEVTEQTEVGKDGQSVQVIDEDSAAEEERRELPITLARVLFLACDVCIYCGGKFIG